MAKNASSIFYWNDWMNDTELQLSSASTRGIWSNALARMAGATPRGKLSGPIEDMPRLLNCTEDEFTKFLNEISFYKFGDVTICNSSVTVVNRRMMREEKERESTRLRVKRHRNGAEKRSCNNEVTTPPIPSPIPIPIPKKETTTEKVIFENGSFKNISSEVMEKWRSAFPAIDIHGEIQKAEAWVISNPQNKKSQWMRFLNGWFTRAQDKAPPKREVFRMPKLEPRHICNKCDMKVHEVVEHRGQMVCENCLRILAPEIPDKMKAILNSIVK